MPKCTDERVEFGRVGRRVVQAAFDGGDIVSDGGVLLLKRVDERLDLSRAAAQAFGDERRSPSVQHSVHSLLAQRIYGLCLGWSDVSDHNLLRNDLVMQTAVGRAEALALPGRWVPRGTDLRLGETEPNLWISRFVTLAFEVAPPSEPATWVPRFTSPVMYRMVQLWSKSRTEMIST